MKDVLIFVSFVYRRVWNDYLDERDRLCSALGLSILGENHLQYDTPYNLYTVPSKDGVDTLLVLCLFFLDVQVFFEVHQVYLHRISRPLNPS